ncbi:unnamed protein product, partial [Leptidea sinapis]
MAMPERDSGIRCGFTASSLIIQKLNATEILVPTQLWSSETNNESMLMKVSQGTADICGGVLRIMHSRVQKLDYAMSIWPFHVGFTYLAERESSNNMFVAPFTTSVQTNWEDLEYLKRKKMNAKFYQNIQTGVKMIRDGQVAYHTEFNQLYPHLSSFTDDQLCKLQFIDTVPERVNIYDIAPVLVLTLMAVVLSLIILLIEYSVAKFTKQRKKESEE